MTNDLHAQVTAVRALAEACALSLDDPDTAEAIANETDLDAALERAVQRDVELRGLIAGCKALKADIDARIARFERARGQIVDALTGAFEATGLNKRELPIATLHWGSDPPAVVITDEAEIPDTYKREVTNVVIDRKAIGQELKAGGTVEGASLNNPRRRVRIRYG